MNIEWRCIKNKNGGFSFTKCWVKANNLFGYVMSDLTSQTWYKITKYSQVKSIIPNLDAGDLLFFDWERDSKIDHSSIINYIQNGTIYYAQHTGAKLNASLKYNMKNKKWNVYIVHVGNYVTWRNMQ